MTKTVKPPVEAKPADPGDPGHDEWLLDESIEETFPASDPILPTRPGSTLGMRHPSTPEKTSDDLKGSPASGTGKS
jgi:hypothetical protein